jgi:dihydropteroate synthase
MGVLNVTPDSFYDGGRYLDPDAAIAHGLELVAEGADIVDVGGESTRPGALPVDPTVEAARVLPVVRALAPAVRVSIDTRHAEVAAAACAAGASLINDVSASLADVAAEARVGLVVMHMQGSPEHMQANPHYDDVVGEVHGFLAARAEAARALGVAEVYVDPGIGFGKTFEHNLALLHALPELVASGSPVLVGMSRKSFLGRLSAPPGSPPLPVTERFESSLASAVYAMCSGVAIVRVHDVKATADAARLVGGGTFELAVGAA